MLQSGHSPHAHRMEVIVGALLRVGVTLSAGVVFLGGVFYLIRYGLTPPNYEIFHGEPTDLCSVSGVVRNALSLQSRRGTIQFGLLLLIATPIARVIFSVFAFARERDSMYVIITLIVLATLLYSLLGGHL